MALPLKLNQQHKDVHAKKSSTRRRKNIVLILVTVNVVGSSGPIKFLANETETVARVIQKTLGAYRRQKRLPILAKDPDDLLLYAADVDAVLNPSVAIGSYGCRNFLLFEKPAGERVKTQTKGSSVKEWIKRSLNFMVPTVY